jgi:cation diffusion facilitator CzcD-associated flavoprotein CzcO
VLLTKGQPMSGVQAPAATTGDAGVERCDVCIVGAGIAGLNALFAASQYLCRDQKVILVDRRGQKGWDIN